MFESIGVMTKKELEARNEVKWETYTKKIQIEARVLGDLAMNHIIPVATQYQTDLIDNVYKMKDLFPAEKAAKLSAKNLELIEEIADRTAFIKEHVDAMVEARKVANKIESEREKAIAYHDNIVPMTGRNSLSHRQAGTHRRQSDVDVAQISRITVYKMKNEG